MQIYNRKVNDFLMQFKTKISSYKNLSFPNKWTFLCNLIQRFLVIKIYLFQTSENAVRDTTIPESNIDNTHNLLGLNLSIIYRDALKLASLWRLFLMDTG